MAECRPVSLADIDGAVAVTNENAAARNRIKPVDCAKKGRFARAGQSHENEDFAFLDVERAIVDAQDEIGFRLDLRAGCAAIRQRQRVADIAAENDADVFECDDGHPLVPISRSQRGRCDQV